MIPGVVKKLLARLGRRNEGRSYKLFLRLEMNDFDNSLSALFLSGPDSDFIAFCSGVLERFPVAVNLIDKASDYGACLDDAMVLFSGYKSDELGSDAHNVAEWKRDEVASGKWILPDADEESASELIARRSFAIIDAAEADELDTDRLTLCIGLFSYAAAFCIPSFDAKSFRRLFVLAWFKYFSTVLSLENNDSPAGKGFIS